MHRKLSSASEPRTQQIRRKHQPSVKSKHKWGAFSRGICARALTRSGRYQCIRAGMKTRIPEPRPRELLTLCEQERERGRAINSAFLPDPFGMRAKSSIANCPEAGSCAAVVLDCGSCACRVNRDILEMRGFVVSRICGLMYGLLMSINLIMVCECFRPGFWESD